MKPGDLVFVVFVEDGDDVTALASTRAVGIAGGLGDAARPLRLFPSLFNEGAAETDADDLL